jgi:hypothetical protein
MHRRVSFRYNIKREKHGVGAFNGRQKRGKTPLKLVRAPEQRARGK